MTEVVRPQRIAAMFGADRVSFVLQGKFRSFLNNSDVGQRVIAELKREAQDIDLIAEMSDIALWVARRSSGRVVVDDRDQLRLNGKTVDYGLAGRIMAVINQGFDFDALSRFVEKVAENPDQSVAADLFRFLEKGNMPLTPDGDFLAFKKVDNDLLSYRSGRNGKVRYPIGEEVSEPREECDANRNRTCSTGLHVCSFEYLNYWYKLYGPGRLLICKVNPRDVTAVPNDHNDQKLRTCLLRVMGEIPEAEAKDYFRSAVDVRYPAQPAARTVEEIEAILTNWTYEGAHAGALAAYADVQMGYEADNTVDWADHEDVPEDQQDAFTAAYVDAYDTAFEAESKLRAPEWTEERVTLEAAHTGKVQAEQDHPAYDNSVSDAGDARAGVWAWIDEQEDYEGAAEDHPLIQLFDRVYRDTYHETFNRLSDTPSEISV